MSDCHNSDKPLENLTTKEPVPVCMGCQNPITDSFLLRVHPDMPWHIACLKCSCCNRLLNESCTCFAREGKIYCKQDYNRMFNSGTTCARCSGAFTSKDFVMRAENLMFHVNCFSCTACSRKLVTGDEFAVREGVIFCAEDNDIINRQSLPENGKTLTKKSNSDSNLTKMKRVKDGKPTRVRTVLSEKQLHTLRTCYGANPRPDALMKEQLVEMTGLSPRVIRVWFQNKRCKDKKKSMLLKHMEQEKNMNINLNAVQMVAQSPLHHDNNLHSIETYHHHTWKRMTPHHDFTHPLNNNDPEINHNSYPSLMGSLYGSDDSAVYLGDEEYMDNIPPDSVGSQFSTQSTSPYSSG